MTSDLTDQSVGGGNMSNTKYKHTNKVDILPLLVFCIESPQLS